MWVNSSYVYRDESNSLIDSKGTTLEDIFHVDISHTPLWSAKAVVEEPETIIQAHLAFLRAGARVLLTSTCVYLLLSFPTWAVLDVWVVLTELFYTQLSMLISYFRTRRIFSDRSERHHA